MANDVKAFFHEWCNKSKAEPTFESRATGKSRRKKKIDSLVQTNQTSNLLILTRYQISSGPKHRQRFLCELSVRWCWKLHDQKGGRKECCARLYQLSSAHERLESRPSAHRRTGRICATIKSKCKICATSLSAAAKCVYRK